MPFGPVAYSLTLVHLALPGIGENWFLNWMAETPVSDTEVRPGKALYRMDHPRGVWL